MDEPFLGQVMLWAGNFIPLGWAACDGTLLSISDNTALFSLIGTTYGGDGITTFGTPDLRGRVPSHFGTGPGLPTYTEGEMIGTETNTLTTLQMPAHLHQVTGTMNVGANSGADESSDSPGGCYLRQTPGVNTYASTMNGQTGKTAINVTMATAGSGQPFENIQPTLALTYCIATQGIYPTRS